MKGVAAYKAVQSKEQTEDWDDLVRRHAPLVKRIACHLKSRLPASVQIDDLVQAGMIGLLDAACNYDPSQGARFETYAGIRIRGAMLDEVRKGDWAPRSLHRKVREMAKAVREIEMQKGREARDSETAERLGISLDEYYQLLQDANEHQLFSLEEVTAALDTVTEGLTDSPPNPLEALENQAFKEALARVIAGLPERERLVLALYYDEEMNLREIGEILGVSESRVSQIGSQALIRLRARMSDWIG